MSLRKRPRRIVAFLITILVIVLLMLHRPPWATSPTACPDCNVILISIDALRADHLGVYGYGRPTSPNLDKFATESLVFEHAFSQANYTLPSMASLFTSLYPSEHQVGYAGATIRLDPSIPTLATLLKAHRYQTAALVRGPYLNPYFGFAEGFDYYDYRSDVTAEALTTNALSWLAAHKGTKWFLWLHYFDVHAPYNPPAPYANLFDPDYHDVRGLSHIQGSKEIMRTLSPRDIEHIIALYDGAIRYVDDQIGRLVERLTSQGFLRNTLVLVTADHGESFSRGMIGHGDLHGVAGKPVLFEELIHVPLIIRHPRGRGRKVEVPAELVDVTPTILGMLGLPIPGSVNGINVFSLPFATTRPTFSEDSGFVVVRTNTFKLAWNPNEPRRTALYDLRTDPEERSPIAVATAPDIVGKLEREIQVWEQAIRRKTEPLQIKTPASPDRPWARVPIISPDRVTSSILSVDPDLFEKGAWQGHVEWLSTQESRMGVIKIEIAGNPASYIGQHINLPPGGRYALGAEVQSAPPSESETSCNCSSTVITIALQDASANAAEAIYADAIDSREGWKTITLDVSKFSGKALTAKIHAAYGGPCPFHCTTSLLVDKFYIAGYNPPEEDKRSESLKSELRALGYTE